MDDDTKQKVDDIRRRLLGNLTLEEAQTLKAQVDALEGLRPLDDSHDHDTDTDGHHDHEHN
jgi:hypothetical protein